MSSNPNSILAISSVAVDDVVVEVEDAEALVVPIPKASEAKLAIDKPTFCDAFAPI